VFKVDFDIRTEVLAELESRLLQDFSVVFGQLDWGPVLQWYQGEVTERLAPYPGPVKLPIPWTSDPQRNYYFGFVAKRDSDGKVIPYQRTFGLQRAWDVRLEGDGIIIENTSSIAQYVVGKQRQQFHANTGWPDAEEIAWDILVDTPALLLVGEALTDYYKGTV
jgi:hypothetical protein